MAIKVQPLTRVFRLGGSEFADPAPRLSDARALDILALSYPQLLNAKRSAPVAEVKSGKLVITLEVPPGVKA